MRASVDNDDLVRWWSYLKPLAGPGGNADQIGIGLMTERSQIQDTCGYEGRVD